MTLSRPRIVLLPGDTPLDPGQLEWLRSEFEVVMLDDDDLPDALHTLRQAFPPQSASAVLERLGEGVGVVDGTGTITWMNARLGEYDPEVRERFADLCLGAIELFNETGAAPATGSESRKFSFRAGDRHFELVASPSSTDEDEHRVASVVGVVWDVTASRSLLDKLDAIDAAGSELMKIEAESIAHLSMQERLQLLEEKIIHYVHDLLHFDDFEIRLLDRETNRLELVMSVGISPERVGVVIHPEPDGSGISGHVAATGESYLCPDVQNDPLYREGLDNAASALTVPLRLHDRTIGVFNIESKTPNAFDENDRQFATIFGRYIAMAMNILNLLLVERYTTNEQVAQTVLGELGEPLKDIIERAEALREEALADGKTRKGLDTIIEAVGKIRRRIEACSSGPRTILGAEQELHRGKPDPAMMGRKVLIADDDLEIRSSVGAILTQRGCEVTICGDGLETIRHIQALAAEEEEEGYDLIISDIKMPDCSGYEVFRTAKEIMPDTPVILMTGFGYDPHHSIVRASQEGLQSFLFKPFKAKQLVAEVKKAFAQPQEPAKSSRGP